MFTKILGALINDMLKRNKFNDLSLKLLKDIFQQKKRKRKRLREMNKRERERVVVWKRLITHQMTRNEIPLLLTYNFLQYSLSWSQIFLRSFFNANVQHNRKMKS